MSAQGEQKVTALANCEYPADRPTSTEPQRDVEDRRRFCLDRATLLQPKVAPGGTVNDPAIIALAKRFERYLRDGE